MARSFFSPFTSWIPQRFTSIPSLYSHAIAIYRSTPFMIVEIFLVFCVIYHGVNGARIALFDLFSPRRWRTGVQSPLCPVHPGFGIRSLAAGSFPDDPQLAGQ